ncbi:putative thioesterase [Westiellopsis prolifica IICB1]|nr:putative thioesterase [Westiellopsis prolifica IICB1]
MPTFLHSGTWVSCPLPNPQANLRLFCFPYAGASTRAFFSWAEHLPSTVELCPIELPGHGPRLKEKAFTQLQPLVEAIAMAILPYLDKPFACFGHSMGALLSFELAHFLQNRYNQSPRHLLLSGRRAPQTPSLAAPIHALPDAAFIQGLRQYNGMPEKVIQNVQLMELLLPMLRADFTLMETYNYVPHSPLDCPMTIFGGLKDLTVSYEALISWQYHTHAEFTVQMFPGNHFFIHSDQELLLLSLSKTLESIC